MWRRGDVRSVTTRSLWLVLVAAIAVVVLWLRPVNLRGPVPMTEIYRGVWYTCDRIDAGDEGSGWYHLVMVDLSAPGVELYVTPVSAAAVAQGGGQYYLSFAETISRNEQLAVTINGTLFDTRGSAPLPGVPAHSNETLVSDGEVNHVHDHSYLLWFDDKLTPHMETRKPPRPEALSRARWGISGQGVSLSRGVLSTSPDPGLVDRRTVIGVNGQRRLLWLAVFENATVRRAVQTLLEQGATEAIAVDGGSSTTMVLGAQSTGVDGGTVLGGQKPVATFVGVRARPLDSSP